MLRHTAGKWIRVGAVAHDHAYTYPIAIVAASPIARHFRTMHQLD